MNLEKQTIFRDLELIIVLNEPTNIEISIADSFYRRYPEQVKIINVNPVESIYSSWNRAWLAARGKYIAAWNVDDRREDDSLERQVRALENNPECSVCYGDYVVVKEIGYKHGYHVITPLFNRNSYIRNFYTGGAFLVWKNSLKDRVGLFDEQLKIAGDYDFVNRCLLAREVFCKADGILGYFTDSNKGLSTRDLFDSTFVEETLVHVRYGNFDKAKRQYLNKIRRFAIDKIYCQNDWIDLNDIIPDYDAYLRKHETRKVIGILIDPIRRAIMALGLWQFFISVKHTLEKRKERM